MSPLKRDIEKLKAWKRSAKRLERGNSRLKRTPLSPVGRRRKRERAEGEVFGPLADKVRGMDCVVDGCHAPGEPHHVKSRGSGHKDRLPDGTGNLTPICSEHHQELHRRGVRTFEEAHGVDLASLAERLSE